MGGSPGSDCSSLSSDCVLIIFAVSGAATSTILVGAAAAAFVTLSRLGGFAAADERSVAAACRWRTPLFLICREAPALGQSAETRIVHLLHHHWSAEDLLPNSL